MSHRYWILGPLENPYLVPHEMGHLVRNSRQGVAINSGRWEVPLLMTPGDSTLIIAIHPLGKVTAQWSPVTGVEICKPFGLVLRVRLPTNLLDELPFLFPWLPWLELSSAWDCIFPCMLQLPPSILLQIFKDLSLSLEQRCFFFLIWHISWSPKVLPVTVFSRSLAH